ncbi:zinc-dependent metalloprotease [Corynebacterium pacaense]|uniref:zinc-dependent metalloprotease n=1 Tax=Corynebacterium pacaense TaxID=1816684 RepID=UPI0009BB7790|nr:zinc-dependent metalloprotease [Corynebacterium pacaense]
MSRLTRSGTTLLLPSHTGRALIYGAIEHGLGSSRILIDRGQSTKVLLVRWRSDGERVVFDSLPHRLGSGSGDDDADLAVTEAFATEFLAAVPVVEGRGGLAVDITELLLADPFHLAESLSQQPWGGASEKSRYRVVPAASRVRTDSERGDIATDLVFRRSPGVTDPRHNPFSTFASTEEEAESWLPSDNISLTLRTWITAVPGEVAVLAHHPRSGGNGPRSIDPRRSDHIDLAVQPRFRPGAPITYLVDPAIPEPFRTAVVEGANWWRSAFAEVGITFEARLPLAGESLWGERTNAIFWVHRTGRGWSLGNSQAAPLTGEILRGTVRLGSERIIQLRQLFEALLQPYGATDEKERLDRIDSVLIERVRLLSAHEIGHSFGFAHNFTTHTHLRSSVMDYPFPALGQSAERGVFFAERAYPTGLSDWDARLLRWAYPERSGVTGRTDAQGFLTEGDAADAVSSAPWVSRRPDETGDALSGLGHILDIRHRALSTFGSSAAPPEAQQGELRDRYTRLFLLHRFQAEEVAGLLAGVDYVYDTVGGSRPVDRVSPEVQRRALAALADLLTGGIVDVPAEILRLVPPAADRIPAGPAEVVSRLGRLFDPISLGAAATAVVVTQVVSAPRLNRVWTQARHDPGFPGVTEVTAALARASTVDNAHVVIHAVVQVLASGELLAGTQDELLALLSRWPDDRQAEKARWAAAVWREDPKAAVHRFPLPTVPPGAPL